MAIDAARCARRWKTLAGGILLEWFGSIAASVALLAAFLLWERRTFAHGCDAIQAGGIMSSMALGLMLGSGSSSRAVTRLGTSRIVADAAFAVSACSGSDLPNEIHEAEAELELLEPIIQDEAA